MRANHGRWSQTSFSQSGEDRIALDIFRRFYGRDALNEPGSYLDVGCYHPFRHSNTALLNLYGWRGVNLDINQSSVELFEKARPGDINLCLAASDSHGSVEIELPTEGLSATAGIKEAPSADPEVAMTHHRLTLGKAPLSSLVSEYFQGNPPDLIDIDVEGHEFSVLRGLSGAPLTSLMLIEYHSELTETHIEASAVGKMARSLGYSLVASTVISHFYVPTEVVDRAR